MKVQISPYQVAARTMELLENAQHYKITETHRKEILATILRRLTSRFRSRPRRTRTKVAVSPTVSNHSGAIATMSKLWGGRFEDKTHALMEQLGESVSFDARLAPWDIRGSIAHARMLGGCAIISGDEAAAIIAGLEAIAEAVAAGSVAWDTGLEDVHGNIEAMLVKRIGDAGKKLHTARSRNDQIATNMRLYRTRWTRFAPCFVICAGPSWTARKNTRTSSCRAIPTCSRRSRSCLPTTCSLISKCSGGTSIASRNCGGA